MQRRRRFESAHGLQDSWDATEPYQSRFRIKRVAIARPIIVAVLVVVLLIGCGCGDEPSVPDVATEPSRDQIIQAVRQSVQGKTHTVTVPRQTQTWRTCSQTDVDLDPYMPGNPELARCPYQGATYPVWQTVYERETRSCDPLPGPGYAWSVRDMGFDRWRVSLSGSTWEIKRVSGGAAALGERVQISGFVFTVEAHQDC
jgi:hypothetical protein